MSRLNRTTGYHIRVDPRRLGDLGAVRMSDSLLEPDAERRVERYRERCEQIATDIIRHADSVGYVQVVAETEAVCGHCGSGWTEGDGDYNGGCCTADQDAFEAATESEAHV